MPPGSSQWTDADRRRANQDAPTRFCRRCLRQVDVTAFDFVGRRDGLGLQGGLTRLRHVCRPCERARRQRVRAAQATPASTTRPRPRLPMPGGRLR